MWTNFKLLWLGNSIALLTSYYLSNPDKFSKSLIRRVTEEKDLGVWCTSDMKKSLQVQEVADKAMQTLGMLRDHSSFVKGLVFILV